MHHRNTQNRAFPGGRFKRNVFFSLPEDREYAVYLDTVLSKLPPRFPLHRHNWPPEGALGAGPVTHSVISGDNQVAALYYYPSIFFARRDDFMPLKG
jgi:hypothetical protein